MSKQTAVHWLHEELLKILIDNQIQQTDYLFDQAEAMEKEQIGRAYQEGLIDGMNHTPKDYYNEAFGDESKT
jgi:hypothetical protein